jgi:AMMECR1 domain-containing protein
MPDGPDDAFGDALLVRARNAIGGEFGVPERPEPHDERLTAPGASFVTLTQDGQLRGCIGALSLQKACEFGHRDSGGKP